MTVSDKLPILWTGTVQCGTSSRKEASFEEAEL